jgi:hypothetical protein
LGREAGRRPSLATFREARVGERLFSNSTGPSLRLNRRNKVKTESGRVIGKLTSAFEIIFNAADVMLAQAHD